MLFERSCVPVPGGLVAARCQGESRQRDWPRGALQMGSLRNKAHRRDREQLSTANLPTARQERDCLARTHLHDFRKVDTTVARTEILRVYGFESIRILFLRGEILQNTGNSLGNLARRILACEMAAPKVAAAPVDRKIGEVYNLRH